MAAKKTIKDRAVLFSKAVVRVAKEPAIVGALLADLIASPAVKVKKAIDALREKDEEERMRNFQRLMSGQFVPEGFEPDSPDATLALRVMRSMLEDDEDSKTWAYAGLFIAFIHKKIEAEKQIRFLRLFRDMPSIDLDRLVTLYTDSARTNGGLRNFIAKHRSDPMIQRLTLAGFITVEGSITQVKISRDFELVGELLTEAKAHAAAVNPQSGDQP